ncbi:MAG TPA: zinc ribbon domain-containing protein [Blastocatellia bacterium]
MFCPSCATQNSDNTRYCRSCGANLSFIPQALTGQLPEAPDRRHGRHSRRDFEHGGPASLANAITKIFMGFGFVLVAGGAFFFAPAGRLWWFWMLIPAFALLGKGVAELVVSMRVGQSMAQGRTETAVSPAPRAGDLGPRNEVFIPPASVTEQTTRQLDPKTDPYRYRDTDRQ